MTSRELAGQAPRWADLTPSRRAALGDALRGALQADTGALPEQIRQAMEASQATILGGPGVLDRLPAILSTPVWHLEDLYTGEPPPVLVESAEMLLAAGNLPLIEVALRQPDAHDQTMFAFALGRRADTGLVAALLERPALPSPAFTGLLRGLAEHAPDGADAAIALDAWMSREGIEEDFTACDTVLLNRFFAAYHAVHGQGGTNTKQRNLQHLFTWLEREHDHPHPYTDDLQRYSPARNRPSTLAGQFITDLFEVTGGGKARGFEDARDHAIIRMLTEGVRRTELVQQQTTDLPVDVIAQPFVRVVPLKGARASTEGRIVALAPATARAIVTYLRARRGHRLAASQALWLGTRNRGALGGSGLYRMLIRRAGEAGYDPDVSPHKFRHTFANDWQRRGVASDATFRVRREDDGAGDPAGALSPPLTASTRKTTGQARSARTRLHQMKRHCIQFRCARCQHVASSSTLKQQRRGQMRHLAVGRAGVFSMVGNPLPTSFNAGVFIEVVRRRLGHASTETTQLYTLLADEVADAEIRAARRRRDRR